MRYRTFNLQIENKADDAKFYPAVLSSESPVERDFGVEILSHEQGAIDMSRARRGLPLLWSHDSRTVIGRVNNIKLTSDKKLRGDLRPGTSDRAKEIWNDVRAGVITDVSLGYDYNGAKPIRQKDGALLFKNWQPMEASLVAIPADVQAGIGRQKNNIQKRITKMNIEEYEDTSPKRSYTEIERARVQGIRSLCRQNKLGQDLTDKMIDDGLSVDEASTVILRELEVRGKTQAYSSRELGMSKSEVGKYSIARAILAASKNDWSGAGLEREASIAHSQRIGKAPQGFFIPSDVLLQTRTVSKGSDGGYAIGTDHLSGNFIDVLRTRTQVLNLGATLMQGLVGDVEIPRQNAAGTGSWVAESTAPGEGDIVLGQVLLQPKTCGARTKYSRKMLLQSSPAIESIITSDLASVIAKAIDLAALAGSGADSQPRGILTHTYALDGINVIDCSGGLDWSKVVEFETAVAAANADIGALGYLASSAVRGQLKATFTNGEYGEIPIWNGDKVNGYPALVSNNLTTAQMIYGNWADVLIGEWGSIDILVNPYGETDFSKGDVAVRVFSDVDVALRHPESFAYTINI